MVVEQPAYPGVGRLGSHAESGLHGRPARARRERYVALAVCHPVVALPLLRCYQEGLASGTLRGGPVMGGSRQYCQKEDSRDSGPWEYGNRPTGGFGKAQAEDWDTWYTLASEGRFKEIPPKFKLSTWATWNASTARTSSSSTKRMCVECGFGVSPVSVRATLPARCSELRYYLSSTISGGMATRARRSSSWRTSTGNDQVSAPPPKDLVRPLGLHRRDERRSGCP